MAALAAAIRYPKLIITYRCEKHRGLTEDWLRRWGCRWDRLFMAPFADWRERDRSLSPVDFKAKHLAESACVGMVESHDSIARSVHKATGKVVIAVETGKVYQQAGGSVVCLRHQLAVKPIIIMSSFPPE